MKAIDLTGRRFGRLLVIERNGSVKGGAAAWLCDCSCGKIHTVSGNSLRMGLTRSCGCLNKDTRTVHGASNHLLYPIWIGMINRCHNKRSQAFRYYGGRGIVVCKKWKQDPFQFFADMGERPSKLYTLDRIDNDGPYSPENCRWATKKEQSFNRRVTLSYMGMNLKHWSNSYGTPYVTLRWRYLNGYRGFRLVAPVVH